MTDRQVRLNWENNDRKVLEWLLKESFQIHNGMISLRGLDSKTMRQDSQAIVHQGILGTFLQHNSTHKSPGTQTKSLPLEEDKPEIVVTYKALQSYAYQDFASNLCDNKSAFLLKKSISVAGWLNPGAVVRHVAFSSDTSFEEPAEQALILLFAPVACYYYILRSKLRDKRAQYALVIPEVTNLEEYAKYRQNQHLRNASYKDFHASGLGDAGLRFLTDRTTTEIANTFKVPRCQVLTLGTVAWSTQQKTRTDLYVVEANAQVCQNYRVCDEFLGDKTIEGKNGGFVSSNFARELIAGNHSRFLYDFSPDSLILRWTHDFAPRILYSFEEDDEGQITASELIRRVESQDINPQELWVAGAIANTSDGKTLAQLGVNVLTGIKLVVETLKQRIARDLQLPVVELTK